MERCKQAGNANKLIPEITLLVYKKITHELQTLLSL